MPINAHLTVKRNTTERLKHKYCDRSNDEENQKGEGYLDNRLSGRPDLQGRYTGIIKKLQPRIREVETFFS